MNEIERQDAVGRRLLWGSLVAFGLWQAGDLVARGFADAALAPAVRRGILLLSLVAWAIWCFFLLRTVWWGRQVRKTPAVAAALEDELTKHLRLRAKAAGFWAMLAVQAVLLFTPYSAGLGARVTIAVGALASLLAFQIGARRSAE